MASSSGYRPPITEGVAEAMVRDIKSGEGKGLTSEVPMAFQTPSGRPPIDPAIVSQSRKQIMLFGGFAIALLVILLGIWWSA